MNTAPLIYSPNESVDSIPEYSIPERISFENQQGSGPNIPTDRKDLSTGLDDELFSDIPKIAVVPPLLKPLKGKFTLLQLWEGRIVEVRETEFDAIIKDKTNPDYGDELVTIDISEVTPDDLPLVLKGYVFYWSVGFLDYPGRGRSRESKIRFRRLRGWTKNEIEQAKKTGKNLAEFFKTHSV